MQPRRQVPNIPAGMLAAMKDSNKAILQNMEDDFVRITLADIMASSSIPLDAIVPSEGGEDLKKKSKDSHSPLYEKFLKHTSATRVDTNTFLLETIRALHPGSVVIATRDFNLNVFDLPGARLKQLPKTELDAHLQFYQPAHRGDKGSLGASITFGCFTVDYASKTFLVYIAQFMESPYFPTTQLFYVHESENAIHELLLAAGTYATELHEEIPVYAHGWWEHDHQLWLDVQKANWDDVILDADFKKRLQDDVNGFFKSEKVYKDLSIPWKRGIILLGPPGNGKTISLKAIMKSCPHPSLYVKNFQSFGGEEYGMQLVFDYARRMSPCIVILEDLDSLINDGNRSFFLNEIDGLQGNDGLLIIGTTNHFDKLDPALSKRPSRFDRKFNFAAPTRDERIQYAHYWQNKLKDNEAVSFPESLVEEIADLTDGFSFAYIKEAMVSSLVIIATAEESKEFAEVVKQQIAALRKSIDDGKDE
ncbi:hypothetical protein FRB90_009123 [Tulasnella sp. 427]|nr:hypothetical protein FRB90_009123 [Tulasnella sp. 427]